MKRYISLLLLFMLSVAGAFAQGGGSLSQSARAEIDRMMNSAIQEGAFPGGQLVVGDSSGIVYSNAYGYTDYSKRERVTSDMVYDLASCTKVLSTTLAIMKLVDSGALTLDAKVGDLISRYSDAPFRDLTLKQLLRHSTGFKPVLPVVFSLVHAADSTTTLLKSRRDSLHPFIYDRGLWSAGEIAYDTTYVSSTPREGYTKVTDKIFLAPCYSERVDTMVYVAFVEERVGSYKYSDVNFLLLQQMVECAAMQPLDNFVAEIYRSMGVDNIGYMPQRWTSIDKIPPTECDMLFRRDTVRGYVHDEMASALGGVAGHAGLFASAESVAALCAMFLRGGEYNGERIIEEETLELFTSESLGGKVFRGLGFDKMNPDTTPYSGKSYGHSGFTGTYFWCDPESNRYLVILTNRVHPTRTIK